MALSCVHAKVTLVTPVQSIALKLWPSRPVMRLNWVFGQRYRVSAAAPSAYAASMELKDLSDTLMGWFGLSSWTISQMKLLGRVFAALTMTR